LADAGGEAALDAAEAGGAGEQDDEGFSHRGGGCGRAGRRRNRG
jgi:hypothetical protein